MNIRIHRSLLLMACAMVSVGWATLGNESVAQETRPPAAEPKLFTSEHIAAHKLEPYLERASKWTKDIAKLTANNKTEGSSDAILFLGSSSVRRWESIAQDIAPFQPVRRGFGGSRYCDVAIYAPTLVKDLEYRACVIFVGNDVTGSNEDKSAQEVSRLAKSVIASVRHQRSSIPVLLVSVTATPSRFKVWEEIQKVNAELRKLGDEMENVDFLDTISEYLTSDGQPRPELFVKDQLHQNEVGYKIWSKLIVGRLGEMLKAK
ncbi:MAG: GDSL-type esterase/lipase family protein [Planctomycetota bacterium]|nr:GDSL-type esterase/lipase family protein [Planctomycetota bacterium]